MVNPPINMKHLSKIEEVVEYNYFILEQYIISFININELEKFRKNVVKEKVYLVKDEE